MILVWTIGDVIGLTIISLVILVAVTGYAVAFVRDLFYWIKRRKT